MWMTIVSICLVLTTVAGCSRNQGEPPSGQARKNRVTAWPKDWSDYLGQTVTLEGTAVNAKLGALLLQEGRDGTAIWIDGLEEWPEGLYQGGDKGKHLRVTGKVIKRDDLPVFVQKPGDPPKAGIPVESEEELEKAKWRFLLSDVKWTVLE